MSSMTAQEGYDRKTEKLTEPARKAVFRYMLSLFIPSAVLIATGSAGLGFLARVVTNQTQMEALREADDEYRKKLFEIFEDANKRVIDRLSELVEKTTSARIQADQAAAAARTTATAARAAADEAEEASRRARVLTDSNIQRLAIELRELGVFQTAAIDLLMPNVNRRLENIDGKLASFPLMVVQTGIAPVGNGSLFRDQRLDVQFPERFRAPPQVMIAISGVQEGLGPPGQPTFFVELVGVPTTEKFTIRVHQNGGDFPHLYRAAISWIAVGEKQNP